MENHYKFIEKRSFFQGVHVLVYEIYPTVLGPMMIGILHDRVCFVGLTEDEHQLFFAFPHTSVSFKRDCHILHEEVLSSIFSGASTPPCLIVGTIFECAILNSLLSVPRGSVSTYAQLAMKAGYPKAVRAVGSALGKNKIAILFPCHRVIKADGTLGEYHWGRYMKKALLEQECVDIKHKQKNTK